MASSGDGEPVQYLYSPDLEDEFYQQNLMLTHPTNILKLDELNPSTAAGGSRRSRYDGDLDQEYCGNNSESDDEDNIEVFKHKLQYFMRGHTTMFKLFASHHWQIN